MLGIPCSGSQKDLFELSVFSLGSVLPDFSGEELDVSLTSVFLL